MNARQNKGFITQLNSPRQHRSIAVKGYVCVMQQKFSFIINPLDQISNQVDSIISCHARQSADGLRKKY